MSVKVVINTKNMDLNDRLRDYVEKKVGKLDRYLDILEEAKVDLTFAQTARSAHDRQVAQVTIRGKGVVLRAEDRTEDIYASVDQVLDKLTRQIERYKGRRWRGRGDGRTAAEAAGASLVAEEQIIVEDAPEIARRKRHQLIPMDEAEAIEQMELLGHSDFFIFLNAITNQVNVLYRRHDDSLGLIETEIA
jgi:putative sigma-54 modulation protein